MVQNPLTSVKLCGHCGAMAIYGLYKVTMDLAVCYELKSEFADDLEPVCDDLCALFLCASKDDDVHLGVHLHAQF